MHPAAELALGIGARIIENGAALLHVELLIGIARNAGGIGCLNIDLWQSIGCREYHRLLRFWCTWVGDDLRLRGGQQRHGHA